MPHASSRPPVPAVVCLQLREPAFLVELAVVRRAIDPSPLVARFVRCAFP